VWRYFNPYPAHRENMAVPTAPKKKQEGMAMEHKKK
jgi:hypothetical protein